MRKLRRRRGYVLVLVLGVLLLLTVVAAALLDSSGDTRSVAAVVVGQRIAASRADFAVQQGIAMVKNNTVAWSTLGACSGPPDGYLVDAGCLPGQFVTSNRVVNTGPELASGRGWNYQWWIYRPTSAAGLPPASQRLVMVYAEGYFGDNAASPSFTSAAIETEVIVPMPTAQTLTPEFDYGTLP
jgi:hypothetical protein